MITCCVCAAIRGAGFDTALPNIITLYEGSAYCIEHLPHVDEATARIRKLKREAELDLKTVA